MLFEDLNLIAPILDALKSEGYLAPTPIQQQAIPRVLAGNDLLGCAQTGTGKTAAFAIPILQLLEQRQQRRTGKPSLKSLILTPTRELAIQIGESFVAYGKNTSVKNTVIFGGVGQHSQVEALRRGPEVLIATPGRLLDLMEQRLVDISRIELFVLDEADRMLDMGFIHDVKRVIAKLPAQRQSLFFSATMPPPIMKLANAILTNPVKVEVNPVASTASLIEQVVYFVEKDNKRKLLIDLLQDATIDRVLVFTRTKHGADRVVKDLLRAEIAAQAIHGNKSQNARQLALKNFKNKVTRVLVATDIAARGIDIDDLTHVINYELPNIPESYVHRIGRTGRAGASGFAIAFCDAEERAYLKDIQKLIGKNVTVQHDHAYAVSAPAKHHTTAEGGGPNLAKPQPARQKNWQPHNKNSKRASFGAQHVPASKKPSVQPNFS
ncbi:MAG: DEAD/DEAH box helicase [Chitinophagaceae bacterium]|nr:DEAD/DEAH box helicase [Chitinophagaceae bacterium]